MFKVGDVLKIDKCDPFKITTITLDPATGEQLILWGEFRSVANARYLVRNAEIDIKSGRTIPVRQSISRNLPVWW